MPHISSFYAKYALILYVHVPRYILLGPVDVKQHSAAAAAAALCSLTQEYGFGEVPGDAVWTVSSGYHHKASCT